MLGKSSSREDPRIKAMSEMMDRIKSGKVELKKTVPREVNFLCIITLVIPCFLFSTEYI